ncbi:hypothetical protein [Limnohabitans sp.]|uniref:hypothetical protein n=1 Tax=Limnohabitans sp. TaxID=1907725 RepID=UPI00286F253E|nr:hypothetical protein [Limnohabitans sp.]
MNSNKKPTAQARAARPLPSDVLSALSNAVARAGSQSKVAAELGVSTAVVNQLLKDRYTGDTATLTSRIRGQYMAEVVQCPVMGTLGRRHCLDNQSRPLAFTNPTRSALHAACKTCANRKDT